MSDFPKQCFLRKPPSASQMQAFDSRDIRQIDTPACQLGSLFADITYGRMRQRYLFENHHAMYTHLVLTEKLWKHLEEVDMECNDMMDMLTVRMAERESVTEHLKSVDQLGWVRKMNNIRSRAEEVVLHDLIYMD